MDSSQWKEEYFPQPEKDEIWDIKDKKVFVEDNYLKYQVSVIITKKGQSKPINKRITRIYGKYHLPQTIIDSLPENCSDTLIMNVLMEYQSKKRIEERKSWTKFGDALIRTEGLSTVSTQDIFFELTHPELISKHPEYHAKYANNDKDKKKITSKITEKAQIICKYCKGSHWSHKCSNKDMILEIKKITDSDLSTLVENGPVQVDMSADQTPLKPSYTNSRDRDNNRDGRDNRNNRDTRDNKGNGGRQGGKYVPPGLRNNQQRNGDRQQRGNDRGGDRQQRDKPQVKGIKINNIVSYAESDEIRQICSNFGNIYRFKLIANNYGAFAFVTYTRQDIADDAMSQLDNYRHENCIWGTEWAKY